YGLPVRPVIVPAAVRDALTEIASHVADVDDPMSVALGAHGPIDVVEIDAAVAVVREYLDGIEQREAYTERGYLINSGEDNGMDFDDALNAQAARFAAAG